MKIAIALTDQSFQRTKSMGIFNVSMGLTKGLMNHPAVTELHILGNDECKDVFPDCPSHVHLHLLDKPVPRRFGRVWWDQFGLSAVVRKIAPDWLILPKGFPPVFSLTGNTKIACYVHDVIWEYYAKLKGKQNPFPWYENIYFQMLGKRALKCSDLVLTSTMFNKERFSVYAPKAKTAVVGIGFDSPPQVKGKEQRKDILLYASQFPHKLTKLAVQRLSSWIKNRPDLAGLKIHVIGNLPNEINLDDSCWIKHNRLPRVELDKLINRCKCSVYFSDYEGYGMPPVESIRAGLPCVASDIPPIRENIPERYLFDNTVQESFIRVMNNAYDCNDAVECPHFPTWAEVTDRCVRALAEHS